MACSCASPARAAEPAAIVLTNNSSLGFGSIVASATAGAVTVSAGGARSASGGAVLGSSVGVSAASFTVTGEPNLTYSIVLPSSVTLTAGGSSMTVDSFTSLPADSGNLGPAGTEEVRVGATLQVSGSQSQASYSGTFDVTVAYN
ncbi:MAG TPA: DUF4402 domain-containing protein [Thermoanaerobaculia bacterium]|nr:DUF4402 domain-containing protein [Thermoanaerobaculia bacterium]